MKFSVGQKVEFVGGLRYELMEDFFEKVGVIVYIPDFLPLCYGIQFDHMPKDELFYCYEPELNLYVNMYDKT